MTFKYTNNATIRSYCRKYYMYQIIVIFSKVIAYIKTISLNQKKGAHYKTLMKMLQVKLCEVNIIL